MPINNFYFTILQHYCPYYYLATPLFLILDVFFGISIRIPFLDNWPLLKYLYYMLVFVFGILMMRAPQLIRKIAVTESGFNIALLIIGFMWPYLNMKADQETYAALVEVYTIEAVTCFAITALTFYFAFHFEEEYLK